MKRNKPTVRDQHIEHRARNDVAALKVQRSGLSRQAPEVMF